MGDAGDNDIGLWTLWPADIPDKTRELLVEI